jgi:transmembrane sensor
MTDSTARTPDDGTLEAATAWHARLQSEADDEAVWTAFTAWLEADEAHRVAFDRVEDLDAALEETAAEVSSRLAAPPHLVVPGRASAPATRRPILRAAAAGLGLLAASLLVVWHATRQGPATEPVAYATGVGETRTVSLDDGSVVELSAGSSIEVAFGATERHVKLEFGEALFHVGKDARRPFIVTAGAHDIRDIGTVFDVARDGARIAITVAEGKVAVSTGAGPQLQLSGGQQAVYGAGAGEAVVRRVDPSTALAWRDGYLNYENASLAEVVSDLNRYFAHRIVIQDARLAARPFSGVLRVEDEDAVVRRLTQIMSLTAERADDGTILLRAAPRRE